MKKKSSQRKNRMKFTFLFLLFPVFMFAQNSVTITGTIKDTDGNPMKNVTITVKGTATSVISGDDGTYSIQVPDNRAIIVFSHVGYDVQERGIGAKNVLDIVLKRTTSELDDVVVIGYGTSKRKDVVTSVSKAPIEDMKKAPVPSFDAMLGGRVAGVNVVSSDGQPGAASKIYIRGTSVSQETSPLYVIDGFPVENMDINSINPNDIESLEVLKDPSSVAIYGSRGANGVILITTKRGKPGIPVVNYNFSIGIQKDVNRVEVMSPYEFVKLQLELDSIISTPTVPSKRFSRIYLDPAQGIDLDYYKNVQGYDWQDLVLQTGKVQSHTLSVSGGNSDTRYAFSGGYYDQKGLVINTGMKRYNGKISLDQKLGKNFKTGVSASHSNTESFGPLAVAGYTGGVIQGMWQYRPVSGINKQDLNNFIDSVAMQDYLNGVTSTFGDNVINPLQQAQNELRKNVSRSSYITSYLEYSFWKKFNLRLSGGYNSSDLRIQQFYNSNTQQGNLIKNIYGAISNPYGINGSVSTSLAQTFSTSNVLTYNTQINKQHRIDALAGFEYNFSKQQTSRFAAINIPQASESLGIASLGLGTPSVAGITGFTKNQIYSLFSRANYNYAGKYYLMLAMRIDGSSKFAYGSQWGYFPSVGAAWTLSEEKFFRKLSPVINYARMRISYGTTGNNRVGDFSYLSQYGFRNDFGYTWNNKNVGGMIPYFYGNSAITWETTKGIDYGIDLNFFKSRISTEFVYYTKTSTNFLLGVRLPFSAGYPNGANSQYQNTGKVTNSGFEFTVNTVNIRKKIFSWRTNFNISFNKNKINYFYDGFESIQTLWNLPGSAVAWVAKVGGPISQFYGYKWGGVYQYEDFNKLANGTYLVKNTVPSYSPEVQPGDPKYSDVNGDGVVDANDQTTLGSPLPIHTGGLTNNFGYKNWSLSVFMQWSYGNKVLNANRVVFESTGGYALNFNQYASYANRWTPNNPTNDIPRARFNRKGDSGSPVPRSSSRIIEDGSFLRLKTIMLAYNLPQNLLKRAKINNVRLSYSAQNLFVWTKYSGSDPEVSTYRTENAASNPFGGTLGTTGVSGAGYTFIQPSSGYEALAGGYDYSPYPRAVTHTLGISVTF